jgi:hypothetical protein
MLGRFISLSDCIFFFSAHFAPTDEAFAKLPSGALKYLLHNQDILTSVLLYHVISGKIEAGDIQDQMLEETILGEDLLIRRDLIGPNCYLIWNFYCTTVDFMINQYHQRPSWVITFLVL